MSNYNERLRQFVIELHRIDAIKLGKFKLKTGLISPIYCDLRVIVSYPELLNELGELLAIYLKSLGEFNVLCGVPYTGLPIATAMSLKTKIPLIMRRKEAKNYGTKKIIEGKYYEGDKCLIIEDVVTSGSSVLETVKDLQNEKIVAANTLVVINREQGGEKILKNNGVNMYSLLTLSQILKILRDLKGVREEDIKEIELYLKGFEQNDNFIKKTSRLITPFAERAKLTKNSATKKLFEIMVEKKTNLCVAVDVTSCEEVLSFANKLGPHICILKTHIDIIKDFNLDFISKLKELSVKHNFLIMEDRKFSDIGHTVSLQFKNVSGWADLITAHSLPGSGLIEGLKKATDKQLGIFLVAQMSSEGNLCNEDYTKATIAMANESLDSVTGIVCQSPQFLDNPELIQLTPGIQKNEIGDGIGQRYVSPEEAILIKGADIGVVGRGILLNNSPSIIEFYKNSLWNAYLKRIEQ